MKLLTAAAMAVLLFAFAGVADSQQPPPDKYVTREEYDKLKQELEAVKAQLQELLKRGAPPQAEMEETLGGIEKELKAVKQQADAAKSGSSKHLLTGSAVAGFTDRRREDSVFSAMVSPILLWRPNDRLLFESELELHLIKDKTHGDSTHVELGYAQMTYLLNDYLTVGAGKFLTPFGIYAERMHPSWINKLPDDPLAFAHLHGGGAMTREALAPSSSLGVQLRGGVACGPTKLNYAVYLSNGPTLHTDMGDTAGALHFDNFSEVDNNKAVGARVGFLPVPQLELGYSVYVARADATKTTRADVGVLLQAVDVSYVRDSDLLRGAVDLKGQWVWSQVERTTYDPTGALGFGPLNFDNERNGGFLQLAYRPSKADWPVLKNLEWVGRFDRFDQPDGPMVNDEQRWTVGLNYWLSPSSVVKAAYQWDDTKGADDQDAFLLQWATGF